MGAARVPAYSQFPQDWTGGCVTCGAGRDGRIPRVLSIAGTDPTGGAGLQALSLIHISEPTRPY